MDTRLDQNEDQRCQLFVCNLRLLFKTLCILGVSSIDTLEEFPALFPVLRMRIHLIHKLVLLSVFFYCPVRNLVDKLPQFRQSFRYPFCEITFEQHHNILNRLYNQIIEVILILLESGDFSHSESE